MNRRELFVGGTALAFLPAVAKAAPSDPWPKLCTDIGHVVNAVPHMDHNEFAKYWLQIITILEGATDSKLINPDWKIFWNWDGGWKDGVIRIDGVGVFRTEHPTPTHYFYIRNSLNQYILSNLFNDLPGRNRVHPLVQRSFDVVENDGVWWYSQTKATRDSIKQDRFWM